MIFGSVCSGIEAASVAWHPLGWKAAWLAEIEPFPSSVLAYHYPSVPNLGDMTALASRVRAGEIIAPDVLVGGTPCQAFSVAGLRQGLNDPRGQLTLRFVELCNAIDHVRRAGRKHPAVIVWENVPGVLSDKTNGFGCLLAGLVGDDDEIKPPHGKWKKSGVVMGPERLAVWRVLDAQFFGVAQRRRRVFVISVSLRHPRAWEIAAAILPVSKGVRRDTAPSRQPRKGITHDLAPCLTSSGRGVERGGDTRGQDPVVAVICMAHGQGGAEVASERSPTLTCNHEAPIIVHGTQDPCVSRDTAFALGRNNGGENVIAIQDCTGREKMQNGKGWNDDGSAYTVDTQATQGVVLPIVETTGEAYASTTETNAYKTLQSLREAFGSESFAQWGLGVLDSLQSPQVLQQGLHGGSIRCEACEGSARLDDSALPCSQDCHGWSMREMRQAGRQRRTPQGRELAEQLARELGAHLSELSRSGSSAKTFLHSMWKASEGIGLLRQALSAIQEVGRPTADKDQSAHTLAVRRLTPVEAERLQGFPDDYTLVEWYECCGERFPERMGNRGCANCEGAKTARLKTAADGPRYKALGNSMAVPVMAWLGKRIQQAVGDKT